MNRFAILLLILIVAALAVLLIHRTRTDVASDLDPSEVYRQPEAAMQQVEALSQLARDGKAAADQARKTLAAVIDGNPASLTALEARALLAELEQALGNNEAAGDQLLDAVRAYPGADGTPRMLYDLGLLLAGPLKRPGEAQAVFERVVNLYPDCALAPESLIRAARLRLSIDPPAQADQFSDLLEFSKANPDHPLADEAILLYSTVTAKRETDHE